MGQWVTPKVALGSHSRRETRGYSMHKVGRSIESIGSVDDVTELIDIRKNQLQSCTNLVLYANYWLAGCHEHKLLVPDPALVE